MKQRTLTGIGIVAFLVLVFLSKSFTNYIFDGFIVLLAMWAGYEMSNLLKKMKFYNNKWIIVLYPLLSYGLFKLSIFKELKMYLVVVLQLALIVALAGIIAIVCLFRKKASDNEIKTRGLKCTIDQFSLFKAVQTMFALIYPCFIVMLLIVVNNIDSMSYIFGEINYGFEISMFILVYTFVVPIFVDTFAMLTGSLFKGKKLCPKISPNKTVSGAVGGLVWGVICALCVYFIFNSIDLYGIHVFNYFNLTWWKILIAGVASSIICQVGDIFESLLKRKANVKDSGNILPGHGGILDRFDSHIANILVAFVLLIIIL